MLVKVICLDGGAQEQEQWINPSLVAKAVRRSKGGFTLYFSGAAAPPLTVKDLPPELLAQTAKGK